MNTVIGEADAIADKRMPQLMRISDVELDVTGTSLQLRHALLSRTPQERAASMGDVGMLRLRITKNIGDYEKTLNSDAARECFAPGLGAKAQFWKLGEANIGLIQTGDRAAALPSWSTRRFRRVTRC